MMFMRSTSQRKSINTTLSICRRDKEKPLLGFDNEMEMARTSK